ncbi:MAG TPA: FAD-binding oxidoreductase [Acidimicrobiales bacterium]
MADLPRSAPVVVVGGGAVGTSTLFHLAATGCRDAVLVERDTLGSGSTGAAAGGIRAQFSDVLNVRVARECAARFARFADEVGGDIGYHRCGYLFLLREDEVAAFEASVAVQRSLGVETAVLRPDEAAELVPGLRTDDLAAATFNPTDGCADPGAVVQGYAAAARRAGARVVQGTAARRILVERGRVAGVDTTDGTIACDRVVCAAGVWSRELAATAGVDLPVRPERRYVHIAEDGGGAAGGGTVGAAGGSGGLPAEVPLTIDFASGFYFHRERPGAPRLLVGGPWAGVDDLAPVALHRVPALADVPIRRGWSGYYEMSPDHNAVVGAAPEPAGFLYGTGFSGHGFQQAPVVGEYLAALALDRPPPLDLSPFSLARFGPSPGSAPAAPRPEAHVV